MYFTKRFIRLVLAGVFPAMLCVVIPDVGALPLLVYNFLLAVFLLVDYSITPKPQAISIERAMDGKLLLSDWNRIQLIIENPTEFPLRGKIRDSVPQGFERDTEIIRFQLVGTERKTVTYRVKPKKRGEYIFPDLHMRISGMLGLCVRSKKLPVSDSVKVYPNLKDMRNRHMTMIQKQRLLAGFQKMRQLGIGTEFESIREYDPGDDYRHINWTVTAREGQLYVNRYEPEKNQYVYLMMDTGRVMNEEIGGITRLDYAVNTAFVLSETVMYHGDNMGLIVFDNGIRRMVKTGKGTEQFQRLAENLYNIDSNEQAADYDRAFSTLQKMQNRCSIVFLLTNPVNMEHANDIVQAWKAYAPQHKVVVLCIKNPVLSLVADKQIINQEDAFTKSAALKLIDDRMRTLSALEFAGISVVESNPDAFALEAVNRYILLKRNR